MRSEVEDYVKQCSSCQIKKLPELWYNYGDCASELKGRLQTVHQQAHKNLIDSKG
jgi:hypothetical protein